MRSDRVEHFLPAFRADATRDGLRVVEPAAADIAVKPAFFV